MRISLALRKWQKPCWRKAWCNGLSETPTLSGRFFHHASLLVETLSLREDNLHKEEVNLLLFRKTYRATFLNRSVCCIIIECVDFLFTYCACKSIYRGC